MLNENNYIEIAKAIRQVGRLNPTNKKDLVKNLSIYFSKDNPNFNEKSFTNMCLTELKLI